MDLINHDQRDRQTDRQGNELLLELTKGTKMTRLESIMNKRKKTVSK